MACASERPIGVAYQTLFRCCVMRCRERAIGFARSEARSPSIPSDCLNLGVGRIRRGVSCHRPERISLVSKRWGKRPRLQARMHGHDCPSLGEQRQGWSHGPWAQPHKCHPAVLAALVYRANGNSESSCRRLPAAQTRPQRSPKTHDASARQHIHKHSHIIPESPPVSTQTW